MKFTLFILVFILLSISSAVAEQAGIFKPGDKVVIQKELPAGAPPSTEVTCPIKPEGSQGCPLNAVFYIRYGQDVAAEYPLRAGTTLLVAINRAGGMDGRVRKIALLRGGKELIFDVRMMNPDGSNNPVLLDGDEIVVQAISEKPAAGGPLRPGDSVFIELKKPTEDIHKITSVYSVSVHGTIKMPMLEKEIPALGISVSTLTRRVEAAYINAGIYSAPIFNVIRPGSVIVCGIPENVVTVAGEIRISAEFPWTKGMTLMEVIKKAGGFTEFAAIHRVKLIRSNKEIVHDLRDIKPDGSNNPILLDQDTIFVPPG